MLQQAYEGENRIKRVQNRVILYGKVDVWL